MPLFGKTTRWVDLVLAWALCGFGLIAQLGAAFRIVRKQFVVQAASSALFPIFLVAATVAPREWAPLSLIFAASMAALVQAVVLFYPLRRELRPTSSQGIRTVTHLVRAAVPVIIATLPTTVFPVSDAFWSRSLPTGGLSFLGLAVRFTVPVAGIVTSGVAMVAFPRLVAFAAERNDEAFGKDLVRILTVCAVRAGAARCDRLCAPRSTRSVRTRARSVWNDRPAGHDRVVAVLSDRNDCGGSL